MSKFAKVFDIEMDQVLVMKEYDANTNAFQLHLVTEVEEFNSRVTMEFSTPEKCDEAYDKIDYETASNYHTGVFQSVHGIENEVSKKLVGNLMDTSDPETDKTV